MTIVFDDKPGPNFFLSGMSEAGFIAPGETYHAILADFIRRTRLDTKPEDWNQEIAERVTLMGLRLKFGSHPDLARRLLATGDEKLRYLAPDDKVWGTRQNGKGRNRLGVLLMQVREEFRGPWCDLMPWTEFQEVQLELGERDKFTIAHDPDRAKTFVNTRYQVIREEFTSESFPEPVTGLSIKRLDRRPIRDWRDMQRIKNELVSPEREACEIYPDERRLVDTANQYHLWVLPAPFHFPFGFTERLVADGGTSKIGAVQRPFEADARPEDAMDGDDVDELIIARLKAAKEAGVI